MEEEKKKKQSNRNKKFQKQKGPDKQVQEAIKVVEESFQDSMKPVVIRDLNGFQRKLMHQHFEKTEEYKVKTYHEEESVIMKVYPVGRLKRLAELKAQEVLIKGETEVLPPMGSFERFVIHDYLKDREGVRTESFGEGKERHVEINPLFGRSPKKVKRRLTR